jgi:hypothetical protein
MNAIPNKPDSTVCITVASHDGHSYWRTTSRALEIAN